MRPRHYCRGRGDAPFTVGDDAMSFNEAAALLPREGRRCVQWSVPFRPLQ
ncbi:hypothetical protein DF3PB_280006 [uncultured Defluviicoccus sp.]|uniref:Uncharacterized protein n=1 Tax=metagenome TaxID=256318 RepID=A0A380TE44_9ZZZZ|nr:hypothetical protein DF3PB_280006 [uncultured Defluviicoccus sp.]